MTIAEFVLKEKNVMNMLSEIQTGLDNMSGMALGLCHGMGIDVPSLLQTLDEGEKLQDLSSANGEA